MFLVIDVTWKLFCQTGNIETYLLLKELEDHPNENNLMHTKTKQEITLELEI